MALVKTAFKTFDYRFYQRSKYTSFFHVLTAISTGNQRF